MTHDDYLHHFLSLDSYGTYATTDNATTSALSHERLVGQNAPCRAVLYFGADPSKPVSPHPPPPDLRRHSLFLTHPLSTSELLDQCHHVWVTDRPASTRERIPIAAVLTRPPQDVDVPKVNGGRTRILIPRAPVLPRPHQHVQVITLGGGFTGLRGPRAAVLPRPL